MQTKSIHPRRAYQLLKLFPFFLFAFLVSSSLAGQETRTVTGKITDSIGTPVSGATVTVNSSKRGTSTNNGGNFSVAVNGNNDTLIVTNIGYIPQRIAVGTNVSLVIGLVTDNSNVMNAVTVVGFGTQRKISVVGAQSSISPSELKLPVANITTLLAGRISGVIGVQRTGEPGRDGADIWIRGISTFGGNSSSPLILVDGIERSISNIDPEDVESFTILKDASGTAVYGVRGANGVILVKTKKGKVGKPQIFFNYNQGFSTFTRIPEMLDGVTFMNLVNEALTTRGQQPKYSQSYIDNTVSGTDPLLYPNVDWMDEVFNTMGYNRRINMNASGGVDNAQYYVSLGYYNETGFLKTDGLEQYNSDLKYTRYNFTSNLNLKLTKTTRLELGIQGYVSNGNYPGETTQAIFGSAMDIPPVEYPVIYPGNFIPGKSSNGGFRNPYSDLTRRGYRNEFRNQTYSNIRLIQDLGMLTTGLSITGMFGFDAYNEHNIKRSKRENTYFPDQNQPYKPDGSLNLIRTFTGTGNYLNYERTNGGSRRFYTESSINYDRGFGKHRVGGMVLFYADDFTNAFAGNFTTSIPERYVGLAARATYSYDDRYFAEFNMGYNGSELFAPGNRFGFFPSFGVGWVPSNEKFFEPLRHVISFLKFRYTDGVTGIGRINGRRFAYLTLLNDNATGYAFGTNFNNTGGINVTDYGVDIQWAESRKKDLGIELKLFNDRLSFTVDFFKERRTGIFLQRQSVPGYIGLTNSPFGNLGVIDNKGIDGNVGFNGRAGKVTFNLLVNFTYNKDELIDDDRPKQVYPWMERRGSNILARYGYVADGLFTSQDEINASAVPGARSRVLPGDIKYKDLNSDGLINDYDKTKIGRGDVPNFVYGFGFNIAYKNFNLGALFQGISNADIMLGGSAIIPFNGGGGLSNAYSIATDRWTNNHQSQDAFYPRLAYGESDNFNNAQESSWWVKDVSFMRLKSAELSYQLPSKWPKRIGLSSSTLYIQGYNLLTFSKFKLWDPELNTGGRANGARYPNVRTISVGINFKF